jgi:hypothetical protein
VFGSVIGSDIGGLVDDCLTPDAKIEMMDAAKAYAKAVEDMSFAAVAPKKKQRQGSLKHGRKISYVFRFCSQVSATKCGRVQSV